MNRTYKAFSLLVQGGGVNIGAVGFVFERQLPQRIYGVVRNIYMR